MEISRLHYFACVFCILSLVGCDISNDPEPELVLQTIGFEGVLPNGVEF